jgi:hypothetical protein
MSEEERPSSSLSSSLPKMSVREVVDRYDLEVDRHSNENGTFAVEEASTPKEKIPSPPRSVAGSSPISEKPAHVRAMFSAWESAMMNGSLPRKSSVESQVSVASAQSQRVPPSPKLVKEHQTKRSFSMMSPWKRSSQRLDTPSIMKKKNSSTSSSSTSISNNNKHRSDRVSKARSAKIEKRVLALNINQKKADCPDHVKAMFSAWNSVMVGGLKDSSGESRGSMKSNTSSSTSMTTMQGTTPESCSSMVSRVSMLSDLKRASASFKVPVPSSPSSTSERLVLEERARLRMLSIAENAEAEKYAIMLRFGTEDGKYPGVSVRDMSQSFWTYPNVFSSHEAIPWFLEHTDLDSRTRIVEIMERMNIMGLIVPAGSNHHVKDKRQFWRFNTKKIARASSLSFFFLYNALSLSFSRTHTHTQIHTQ